MAFPSVVNSNTTSSSGSSSLALNMPASIVAGNLLLNISTAAVNDASTTAMSGWTAITPAAQRTSGTATIAVWGKIAAGGDTGTVTGSSAIRCCVTYQISSWSGSLSDVKAALLAGSISTMDPPALTPGFGALDYLWLAVGYTHGLQTPSAPSNYTNSISSINGSNQMTACQRSLNATSEDPGQFGGGVGNGMAGTIAIKPLTNVSLSRSASETIAGSVAVTGAPLYPRGLTETLTINDLASRSANRTYGRTAGEVVAVTDSAVLQRSTYLSTAEINDRAAANDEATDVVGVLPAPLLKLSALVGDTDNIIASALNKLMTFPPVAPSSSRLANIGLYSNVAETISAAETADWYPDQKLSEDVGGDDTVDVAYSQDVEDVVATFDVADASVQSF